MKRAALTLIAVLVLVLAVVVARRMDATAMAVVVGVVCGIGASIPTVVLMLYVMARERERPAAPPVQHVHYTYIDARSVHGSPRSFGPATGRELVRRGWTEEE